MNIYYKEALDNIKIQNYNIAIENYKEIIKLNPYDINKYLCELSEIYKLQNKFNEMIECYIKIIQTDENNIIILNEICDYYFNQSIYKLAIIYYKKLLIIEEAYDIYYNIGLCYINMKEYKIAEENYLKSYNMNKSNNMIKSSLVELYYFLKDYEKSINIFNKIENNIPDYHLILYNISFTYCAKKDFIKGFELYENRLKITNVNNKSDNIKNRAEVSINYWNGIDNINKLLIIYEQGIGDNIMYYRFIIQLSELYPNMKITYICKEEVKDIFKTFKNINIVTNITITDYNFKLYIMSLPYILKLNKIDRNEIDYINVNENKISYWKEKLSHLTKKKKVGFVYNGLLTSFIEKTIPIEEFKILADMDIDLICLHKKNDIIDRKDYINYFDIDVDKPFEDTIAILKNIDLLITIDTYIVHLAGVLNIKTWLLLGNYSEWRWSNEDTNYWYNSVELIRINEDIEFNLIIKNVKNKLITLLL